MNLHHNSLPAWPADAVQRRPVAALVPYARNARTHSAEQVSQIAESIRRFGFTVPVLVDETGGIIAGHGRVLAAKQLGLADVPVMIAAGWSDEQKRAYVIADNKLALNAGWDDGLLAAELMALRELDFDLGATGFLDDELAALFAKAQPFNADPDDVPDVPETPVAQPGDLWRLGDHRVLCGDATKAEDVARLLDGAKPHLMVTDPPYGVEYDADWRNRALRSDGTPSDGRAIGKIDNDDRRDWTDAWKLFGGDAAYCWHADRHASSVQASLEGAEFEIRCQIMWAKSRFVIGRGDYHWQHEPCWYAVRKGRKSGWQGDRSQTTLWEVAHTKSETGHSTQKPVECMRRPILNNSRAGDAVYDPFLGSGTTVIAAQLECRRCYGIEINPAYVDVTVTRWENFTGQKATRA